MKKKIISFLLLFLVLFASCSLQETSGKKSDKKVLFSQGDSRSNESVNELRNSNAKSVINEDFQSGNSGWNTLNCNGSIVESGASGNSVFQITPDELGNSIYLYKSIYNSNPLSRDMGLKFYNNSAISSGSNFEVNYLLYVISENSQDPLWLRTQVYSYEHGNVVNYSDTITVNIPKGTKTVYWAIEINTTTTDYIQIDDISVSYEESNIIIPTGFIRANGKKVFKGSSPFVMKSVSFSNYYFSGDHADYTNYKHHDASDWYNVKEIGFNTVRFAYNADWWVNDPQKFWAWLDKNVDDAEAAGVYLILDMHVPIGDAYLDQSGDVSERNTIFNNKDYRDKFDQLTGELANRYKDREIIAAYQILNEPVTAEGKEQWIGDKSEGIKGMAQELVDIVRTYDKNHMIMVDLVCGENGKYNLGPEERFFSVDDEQNNIIYNFNYYNPIDFTHQGATWTEVPMPVDIIYPNNEQIHPKTNDIGQYYKTFSPLKPEHMSQFFGGANIRTGDEPVTEWTDFESIYSVPSGGVVINNFIASYELKAIDFVGDIDVKDIKIERVSKFQLNHPVEMVFHDNIDASAKLKWHVNSPNEEHKGRYTVVSDKDKDEHYLNINSPDATSGSLGRSKYFKGHRNYNWFKISGKMRGIVKSGHVGLVITYYDDFINNQDLSSDIEYMTENKEYLEYLMEPFIQWKNSINAPVSIAEFGIMKYCFQNVTGTDMNRGGKLYVDDLLSIIIDNDFQCFNYWNYHCNTMGIYDNEHEVNGEKKPNLYQPRKDSRIEVDLIEVLKRKLN